jgi:methylglutaconyl-CoA hydratase
MTRYSLLLKAHLLFRNFLQTSIFHTESRANERGLALVSLDTSYNCFMPSILAHDVLPVRVLTLNRPEVRNALNREMRRRLYEALLETQHTASIRAVVLTGAGTTFCAGMDLAELETLQQNSYEENLEDARSLGQLFERIYTFPKPVIAAVNGHAVAGGAGLASVCDFIVMNSSANLGYTETRLGFVAALVGIFLLRQVGERRARDLLLSARLISASEALNFGLVNELQPEEKVLERALELATQVSQNAPNALAMTKDLLTTLPGLSLKESLDYAAEVNAKARSSDELKEGLRAFLEKR